MLGRTRSPLSWNTGLGLMPRILLRTNGYQILRGLKMARRTGGPSCYQVRVKEATSGSFQPVSHFTSLSHHISPGYIFIAPHPGSSEWRCVAGLSRFTEEAGEQAARLRHPACEDRHGHSLSTEALFWLEKEKSSWRPRAHISLEVEVPEFLPRKGIRPQYC